MSRSTVLSADEQFARVQPALRPIVEAARRAVREAAPEAVEVPYQSRPPRSPSTMWKLARYTVDGESAIGIGTFTNHATLFFQRGAELDDGSGLLQGGGRSARFITLRKPSDAEAPAVKEVIRRAASRP